jgi:glycosyltransferase involved in cell wall biosynthesis
MADRSDTSPSIPARPRVLWLHTQPEHYFNCMMDDLQGLGEFEFVAAFMHRGAGLYKDNPTPTKTQTVFLTPTAGEGAQPRAGFFGKYHRDWRAELQPLGYDAAIVSGYGSRTAREVILDCHRRGIPVAMWSDSNLRSQRGRTLKARVKRRAKKLMLRRIIAATDVLMPTNSLGVAYWRYFGASRGRIVLCPYYSDYARAEAARRTPCTAAMEKLGLKAEEKYFFSAARLVADKGLDQMIRAFIGGKFAERGYRYFITGVGQLEGELKALAGEACGKSIHFLGFQQPRENLLIMAHAEAFVLPSVYEPHGIVIVEAMACGTPVIASDVCGAAYDLVKPGVNGEIFRVGDVAGLQKKLADVIGDETRHAGMRAAARRDFEAWLEATSPIKVVPAVVRRLLGKRSITKDA